MENFCDTIFIHLFDWNVYLLSIYGIVNSFFLSIEFSINAQSSHQMTFVAGYGMAWMSYTQFFFICEMGEVFQVEFLFSKFLQCLLQNYLNFYTFISE